VDRGGRVGVDRGGQGGWVGVDRGGQRQRRDGGPHPAVDAQVPQRDLELLERAGHVIRWLRRTGRLVLVHPRTASSPMRNVHHPLWLTRT